ncbi:MAG TPA: acetylglutamate kinase, partial [Candidatus Thermoplasmatota archaeon]|nr:acetylglutamate kinase [Candidatus Thermoplasmatota archaeon]
VETPEGLARIAKDVATLHAWGAKVVLIHGGGAQITKALETAGLAARFVRGLRVTDGPTLAIAETVLTRVGKDVAHAVSRAGVPALALTGRDAGLLTGAIKDPELGFVGSVSAVNGEVVRFLSFNGFVPVIAPIALTPEGQALNVNADEVATAMASALAAKALVLMTDVDAVKGVDGQPISELPAPEARRLVEINAASGGMIPKLESALAALEGGVKHVNIVNGNTPGILLAVAQGETKGTRVTPGASLQ